MTNTITITNKDGQVWNIHRSIIDQFALKSEAEMEAFLARFFAWFDPWEKDILLSLVRMEREGIAIDGAITLQYNR